MSNTKEHSFYILLLILISGLSFGAGYFVFLHQNKEFKQIETQNILSIDAEKIIPTDITVQSNYVGHVEAINQVQITPYISGYIDKVAILPGQMVKKGDLLLLINDAEYKAKVDAAEANVLQATAAFEYSKNFYERVKKSGKKAFSEIDIDNAENDYLQKQANLKSAKATKEFADINYQYTKIRAPIDGLIGNFNLTTGDYVAPDGSPLLSLIQFSPIRVVFSLTDVEYLNMMESGELFKDSVIQLTLPDGTVFKNNGKFKYTDNHFNSATNSLAIYAYFDNHKQKLIPESYVQVNILKSFKNIVLIPKDKVKMLADGNFVNIARNGTIHAFPIHILSEKENHYIVENTFNTDDLLIINSIANIPHNATLKFILSKEHI